MYGVPSLQEQTFNSRFTAYEGNCSASMIKSLITQIRTSNVSNNAEGPADENYVLYTGPEAQEIRLKKRYTVELKYNNEGYVCEVIVTENEEEDSNETQNNHVNEINNSTENTNEEVIKPIQR